MSLIDRSPVFVVGAQRSGTTWVQRLLAAHPRIVSGQESHLFSGYLAPMWNRWRDETVARDGGRSVGLACYVTEEEFTEISRDLARRVYGRLERAKPDATLLVEKTPDHGLHLPLIHRLFPNATVVHVLRDGRDVVASMRAAAQEPWGRSWATADIQEATRRWSCWVQTIRRDIGPIARSCTVRYEELSQCGPQILDALYEFLGVPLARPLVEAIYEHGGFDKSTGKAPESLVLAGEYQEKSPREPDGFFRRGTPGGWKSDLSAAEQAIVHAAAGELLTELGYR